MKSKRIIAMVMAAMLLTGQPVQAAEAEFTDDAMTEMLEAPDLFSDSGVSEAEVTELEIPEATSPVEEVFPAQETKQDYELTACENQDFGSRPLGYEDYVGGAIFFQNTGSKPMHIKSVSGLKNFYLDRPLGLGEELKPGVCWNNAVYAKKGLPWGTYEEKLTITTEEGAQAFLRVKVIIGPSSDKEYDVEVPYYSEDSSEIVFGYVTADDGWDEWPYQHIYIRNRGRKAVSVGFNTSKNFNADFEIDSKKVIEPGDFTVVRVSPKYADGVYEENLQITVTGGMVFSYKLIQNAPHIPTADELVKVEIPSKLNFGTEVVCYPEAPAAKKVKVTNISKENIRLQWKKDYYEFETGSFSKEELKPGESAVCTIRPRIGLSSQNYNGWRLTFLIYDSKGNCAEKAVSANFKVTPYCIKELKPLEPVRNLSNGKEKTPKALGLPGVDASLQEEDEEEIGLSVQWDLENCSYDPSIKEEQNFTVNGIAVLPDYARNYKNVDLHVSVDVQVKAYEYLGKPVIIQVDECYSNRIFVMLEDDINGADGYDYALGNEADFTKTGKIVKKSENHTELHTYIEKVEKGEYYLSCRAYDLKDSKKTFSPWADPMQVTMKARRPGQAVIKSVKVNKDTVTVTVNTCADTVGFDAVLSAKYNSGEPQEHKYIVKNNTTKTLVFEHVKNGTYYLGVHAYNYDADKCFGDWSKLRKVVVKDGIPAGNPKIERTRLRKNLLAFTVTLPKGFKGYDAVLINTKKPYEYAYIKKNELNGASVANITPGTYELRVHAWVKCRGKKVFSDWVTWPKKIRVK